VRDWSGRSRGEDRLAVAARVELLGEEGVDRVKNGANFVDEVVGIPLFYEANLPFHCRWCCKDCSLIDDCSRKDNFNSAAVITEFSLISHLKQVSRRLFSFLGLLDHSFLTECPPTACL
jgi:hypothetical protein